MAESPSGVIPESLMRPELRADVILWLAEQSLPGTYKRELLAGWAMHVHVRLTKEDYATVERS